MFVGASSQFLFFKCVSFQSHRCQFSYQLIFLAFTFIQRQLGKAMMVTGTSDQSALCNSTSPNTLGWLIPQDLKQTGNPLAPNTLFWHIMTMSLLIPIEHHNGVLKNTFHFHPCTSFWGVCHFSQPLRRPTFSSSSTALAGASSSSFRRTCSPFAMDVLAFGCWPREKGWEKVENKQSKQQTTAKGVKS